jgi:hypothetical protein
MSTSNFLQNASSSADSFARRTPHTMERLQRERSQATFPVREMTHFLDGGRDMTAMKVRSCTKGRPGESLAGMRVLVHRVS